MCNLQYKQAKMIGNVVNLVNNTPYVHLPEWQLRHKPFHFKLSWSSNMRYFGAIVYP